MIPSDLCRIVVLYPYCAPYATGIEVQLSPVDLAEGRLHQLKSQKPFFLMRLFVSNWQNISTFKYCNRDMHLKHS